MPFLPTETLLSTTIRALTEGLIHQHGILHNTALDRWAHFTAKDMHH